MSRPKSPDVALRRFRDSLWLRVPVKVRKAIQRYADAQEADSWKGGGDPDCIPAIERELEAAKLALAVTLAESLLITGAV